MNQQLSRIKTYGSQRTRQSEKSKSHERLPEPHEVVPVAETAVIAEEAGQVQLTSISVPRSKRKALASSLESPVLPSRIPARSKKTKQANGDEESTVVAEELPTRTQLHPSRRLRFSKRFVNSLIFIFVMLTISLVWWGIKGAPAPSTFLPWWPS